MKKHIETEFFVETKTDMEITRENGNEIVKQYINREMTDKEWIWFEEKGSDEILFSFQDEICSHSSDITDNLIHDFVRDYFVPHLNKENKNEN
jgi:hypothetical protein